MQANLFKALTRNSILVISSRAGHINHPGHKPHKRIIEPKYELPDEYVKDEPVYPPVKPEYPPGTFDRSINPSLAWHYYQEGEKFHSLKTIQERMSVMAYLNIQSTLDDIGKRRIRHYPLHLLSALPAAMRATQFNQYITKTHLAEKDSLQQFPQAHKAPISKELYAKVKESIADCILTSLLHKKDSSENLLENFEDPEKYKPEVLEFENRIKLAEERSDELIRDIFDSVTTLLAAQPEFAYLREAQYGKNVNVQAYWKRCGYKAVNPRGAVSPDHDTIRFQFRDKAAYQIKLANPLKALHKFSDIKWEDFSVPDYRYSPTNFKVFADHTLPYQVPGHWYGDKREFNFVTVYNLAQIGRKEFKYGMDESWADIQSMALNTGHAELTAQAYYLGFSMWKDLTYPLLGQVVITNGQDYVFSKYQLNTLQLWNPSAPAKNICYLTKSQRLFELNKERTGIEYFNDSVLVSLLEMLTQKPVQKETDIVEKYSQIDHMIGGTALRPYLSVHDFEKQLGMRRKLLAISLYEAIKYDKPATYLNIHNDQIPKGDKVKVDHDYNRITYQFRDIVLKYYPRDFYGFELLRHMLMKNKKHKEWYWDLLDPVYEWSTMPPQHTNNVKRDIRLPTY